MQLEESITPNEPKPSKKRRSIILVTLALVVVALGISGYISRLNDESIVAPQSQEPTRTEFGSKPPTDFPTNIPVEEGVTVDQSYSLDYNGEKQLTIVFPSTKTIKQNYALYADFLKSDGWVVTNTHESEMVASLYGTKDKNEINITISTGRPNTTAQSQVSISVLKK